MNKIEIRGNMEGIAIIGISGRFPGAKNIDQFWNNLRNGIESISFFNDQELEALGVDPALLNHPNYVTANGILENVEWFDASFFGYNPKEAEIIDPQQRLFLECAWEALENAGYTPESYQGQIGVYAGSSMNTYLMNNLGAKPNFNDAVGYQVLLGSLSDFLTTRVSYKFNLKGPSLNVQTACSTSLVAVQLAYQSLLNYQCDMALAGGVSISFPQKTGYLYQEGMIKSPDGHCRAFDAGAKGVVSGGGIGIVVLKRLEEALEDGDYIYSVIKGIAINNDGSSKVGFTAPSVDGQAEVIAMAQALAEADPETITYVEAHGTGTPLGDPIEVAALTQAFATTRRGYCAIGSVKTNIGHLDIAAGIAGLIKTALALDHKQIPPSLHFKQPNPKIDFANSPFYVNTELAEWKINGTPRRAGVSSFGMGGTNAHAVLEEAPSFERVSTSRPWQLLLLSAKTSTALEKTTRNMVEHFKRQPNLNLADVAYTLQVGRSIFNYKRFVLCQNIADAANTLETLDPKQVLSVTKEATHHRSVVFMFTGQGAQYVQMGRGLYQTEPIFQKQVDFCAEFLKPHLGLDLRGVLYPNEAEEESATEQLRQTFITQPALFVIEYALAKLWQQWGIQPQAMIGHSIGEYVAACLAGVFSLKDALGLVAARGRLMQDLPTGAMLAVQLPEARLSSLLNPSVSLAAVNGPSLCVVSGPHQAIEAFEAKLTEQDINSRRLRTSHAFHSEMMAPILSLFIGQFKNITLQTPQIPFISNVTGTWITSTEATDPAYWAKHLRLTVRFAQGVETLLEEPAPVLLEIGPGNTLSSLARRHPVISKEHTALSSLRHPHERFADVPFLLNTLGRLWLAGIQIDWSGFYAQEKRYRVPLPPYPFERQLYWVEPRKQTSGTEGFLVQKPNIEDWFYFPSWKRSIVPQPFAIDALMKQNLHWLIFCDACGLGDKIVEYLKRSKQDVTTVMVGEQFDHVNDNAYTIHPQSESDYNALVKELYHSNRVPDMIMHLWSVTPDDQTELDSERVDKAQNIGLYSLLFLARAIGLQGFIHDIRIGVVSNNLHEVVGTETLHPEKATILGPCKLIPEEYPNIKCRGIDIVLSESEQTPIAYIIAELIEGSSEQICTYRGLHRWVQIVEPVRLNQTAKGTTRIKEDGVYLITGGLGGIGLALAEYLARTVRAKLILTGRSTFPNGEVWEQWLSDHEDKDDVSRKIRKLLELERLGAETLVLSADVANLEEMQAVVVQAKKRFGQINGVIHAAGVVDDGGVIQGRTREKTERSLASKVKGTVVLDKVISGVQLDFFILCSSVYSFLPWAKVGEAGDSAANEFLDAYCHYRNFSRKQFTATINWTNWQETGMSFRASQQSKETGHVLQGYQSESLKGFHPSEGLAAFERIMSGNFSQVIVSTQDLKSMIAERFGAKVASLSKSTDNLHLRPDLSTAYHAPRNEFERKVTGIWQDLLGIGQIGIHDDFLELGGHSLLATQVVSRLREIFQIELPVTSVFEAATPAKLAEHIEVILLTMNNIAENNPGTADREELEL
jgi:acyl transferase domain-containing protein